VKGVVVSAPSSLMRTSPVEDHCKSGVLSLQELSASCGCLLPGGAEISVRPGDHETFPSLLPPTEW
jgi:hypothetical protein